ncbi:MAG: FprA family A-type flavoprotein [Clostridia bacterium]|nr:FprA family A-type flavoprotein [Clostridia bacterium]
MQITDTVKYVGVDDTKIDLFEGQYRVPNGISYNSYVIIDEQIAVMDSVDARYGKQWLENIERTLSGREPDYLVIHHMEPDHSASIVDFTEKYPNAKIVSSAKAFVMMANFFGNDFKDKDKQIVVGEGGKLSLGVHELTFVTAPMVHWPEVLMSYDSKDKILFAADGFGKFGIPSADEEWIDEARRYYIGIVGKYGAQVQSVLKKAAGLDISIICSLHGPVLTENLGYYISLYDKWSSYTPECDGVTVAYASIYGNTRRAAELLAKELSDLGVSVELFDLTVCDKAAAIASAFKNSKLVLASVTYNADVFPAMKEYIHGLVERGYSRRTVALIENGSWAPMAAKVMRGMLEGSKELTVSETAVKISSALNDASRAQIAALAEELA